MKNKPIKLLLPILFLCSFVAISMAITGSSNDRLSLNEIWTFQADDRIIATPILIDDQIIFRTADKIYSISAVNGNMNWEATAKASDITINVNDIGKPIVGNSKFLISEEQDNSISIYSTKTGEKLWTVDAQVTSINAPIEIVDDVMIVARHDASLIVYDLTTHQKLWETALPPRSFTPIVANTDFVSVGMGDVLRVYGLKDGNLLNEKTYAESLVAEIALSGSNIFVSVANNGDWRISSLKLDSLDENWMFHAGEITHPYLSVIGDYLSLFNKTLLLLDTKSGKVLWEGDTQEYYLAPVFYQNNFFFISKQKMFDRNRKMCKIEISKGTIDGCSVVGGTGRIFETLQPPGLLATNDLLIIPQGSEITAFTTP